MDEPPNFEVGHGEFFLPSSLIVSLVHAGSIVHNIFLTIFVFKSLFFFYSFNEALFTSPLKPSRSDDVTLKSRNKKYATLSSGLTREKKFGDKKSGEIYLGRVCRKKSHVVFVTFFSRKITETVKQRNLYRTSFRQNGKEEKITKVGLFIKFQFHAVNARFDFC